MKQFLFLILALVAMFMGLSLCSKSPTPTKVSGTDQKPLDEKPFDGNLFKDQVIQSLGPSPATWNGIRFEEMRKDSFRLTLVYQRLPANFSQVKDDTYQIARAVLKVLAQDGRKPHEERITVFVHAHIPEKGETGADMVRSFGRTVYNYNTDQLEFEPAR